MRPPSPSSHIQSAGTTADRKERTTSCTTPSSSARDAPVLRQRCCWPGRDIECCWSIEPLFQATSISTHIIWPHGAGILDRWGLLDRLAATGCPPIALNLIFDVGPFALKGAVTDANGGRGGFCPRRTVLDKLLVDAAVEAGAELREGFTVEALLWDGDRVAGINGHSRTGGTVEERARVVIGADGVHSLVARAVRARGVRREAAAHHELLQLLQRIRGGRSSRSTSATTKPSAVFQRTAV